MDKKFDSKLVYGDNDKKSYEDRITTNFQGKKYQKNMHHISVYH